jgi:ketosteroid isomerase-like protein
MLICPNCKILYEKSTNCIKCGSPLVEKDSFKEEEAKPPFQPEIEKETPLAETKKETRPAEIRKETSPIQKPALSPIPSTKMKKEKAEPELDRGKAIHEVMDDEQGPSDAVPDKPKREVTHSDKIQIRIPDFSKFSYQRVGIIIVILIGGYLLWSIYSHLSKKPDASRPVSEEVSNLPSAKSSNHTKPLEPPAEPKIAVKQPIEKPSVPEEKPAAIPSPPSIPMASKASLPETSLSDEKEVENIENIFENIRKANLRNDVDLFMSCYSKSFKDWERKKRGVLKNWEDFTYIDLTYDVRKLTISGNTAVVRIEWVTLFSAKGGGRYQKSKSLSDVTLNKEPDGWKIKDIKPVS